MDRNIIYKHNNGNSDNDTTVSSTTNHAYTHNYVSKYASTSTYNSTSASLGLIDQTLFV